MSGLKNIHETLEVISQVLIRCFIMGVLVLLFWWGALTLMGDFVYRVHNAFVSIPREQFNVIQYTGMLLIKMVVFILFFFPYLAIKLVNKKQGA